MWCLHPIDEPTDRVSSLAYASKVSGELHVCLDPHDLSNAICRDHPCTPTVDKVAHEFTHISTLQSWISDMDAGQSSFTPNPVCSPPLTSHMVYITFYISPLA